MTLILHHLCFALLVAVSLFGWGLTCARILQRISGNATFSQQITISDAVMLGPLLIYLLLMPLHLALPISEPVAWATWALGVVLVIVNRQPANALLAQISGRGWAFGLFCLVAIVTAGLLNRPYNDMGLTYLPLLQWMQGESMVLGLANLHIRFGYNTLWPSFTSIALFDQLPVRFVFVPGWIITLAGLTAILQRLGRLAALPNGSVFAAFALLVLIQLIFSDFTGRSLASNSSDLGSGLLWLYIFVLVLQLVAEKRADLGHDAAILIPVLTAMAIMSKMSTVVLLLIVGGLCVMLWTRNPSPRQRIRLACLILACALAGLVWMLRGYALAGCPAVPSGLLCLTSLPWTVDQSYLASDLTNMKLWSRWPAPPAELRSEILDSYVWIPGWWQALQDSSSWSGAKMILWLLAVLVIWRVWRGGKGSKGDTRGTARPPISQRFNALDLTRQDWTSAALLFTIALCGLAFWFLTAPLPRYGQAQHITLLALLFAPAFALCLRAEQMQRLAPFAVALAIFPSQVIVQSIIHIDPGQAGWTQRMSLEFLRDQRPEGGYQAADGTRVNAPVIKDQCWFLPRPCTPHRRSQIEFELESWPPMIRSTASRNSGPNASTDRMER